MLKVDSLGDTLWTTLYSSTSHIWRRDCVRITSDGGYVTTGGGVYRFDNKGNLLWKNEPSWTCHWVEETSDGDYIVTGEKYHQLSDDPEDWCTTLELMKIDANGNQEWARTYGWLTTWSFCSGHCVQQTSDGGYIVSGPAGPDGYLWLIKTDSEGLEQWEIMDLDARGGESVRQTADGGFIVTGQLPWTNGGILLRKSDSLGETEWEKSYGIESTSYGWCLQLTSDGGYVVTGQGVIGGAWGKVLLKTDSLGDTLWVRNYGDNRSYYVQETLDGGYILTGVESGNGGDLWLCKVDSLGYIAGGIEEQPQPDHHLPTFKVVTTVGNNIVLRFSPSESGSQGSSVAVFDAAGRQVDEIDIPQTGGIVNWGAEFSPGVYFFRDVDGSQTQKAVLVR